jgi:hypothetical protein
MSFYKEIAPFIEHVRSIRKLKNYLSFDLEFPSKWSIPKSLVEEGQVVAFESEDATKKGISFVSMFDDKNISQTLDKVAKIIKLNKEKEIKEELFKQTIVQLKETFEKTDLDKLKTLYFDFEIEETELEINHESETGEDITVAEQRESEG